VCPGPARAIFLRQWGVVAIDSRPETRLARTFQQRLAGRVWLIHLTGPKRQALDINWSQQEASVVRTLAIDGMVELVRRQMNYLPQDLPEHYVNHMTANIRRVLVHPVTMESEVEWHPTRADDYAMAEVFDMVACELYWAREKVLSQSGERLTPLDEMVRFRRSDVTELGGEDEYRHKLGLPSRSFTTSGTPSGSSPVPPILTLIASQDPHGCAGRLCQGCRDCSSGAYPGAYLGICERGGAFLAAFYPRRCDRSPSRGCRRRC
jgi:hypothetical protein